MIKGKIVKKSQFIVILLGYFKSFFYFCGKITLCCEFS
ncbi:hypothetical protein SAMN05216463_110123 [Xylanibacter ruminicola]|jgi:hypothetical protein|uniref:Uncharacterized protein n=1 Tax=Xylanibacter ruminicola TaxID=839 RepID=A0A1M6UTP6_XYLRU|nr:hypothetical protein SAMN05216463_110123 [Xylanibacter ruminicola]